MIEKDTSRVKYLAPNEAVDYGIIDKVLYPEQLRVEVSKDNVDGDGDDDGVVIF